MNAATIIFYAISAMILDSVMRATDDDEAPRGGTI